MKGWMRGLAAFLAASVVYVLFFLAQERAFEQEYTTLKIIPSAPLMRVLTGYGRQLAAETAFVQTSVFLGGVPPATDPLTYAPVLTHNYKVIAQLYPAFSDTYYYAQSYLAGVDVASTRAVNEILDYGRGAKPDSFTYPFFQGFNCFSYLGEPAKAATIFREASQIPNAPPNFAHLAVLLQAEGGELEASVYGLEVLMRTTSDRHRRELYAEEIRMFKQALEVQKAVGVFLMHNQRYPQTLEELIPLYIPALPDFDGIFDLTWNAPNVGLKRPRTQAFDGVRSQ